MKKLTAVFGNPRHRVDQVVLDGDATGIAPNKIALEKRAGKVVRRSMAKRRAMIDKQREWVGGMVLVPRYVTGEGEPYKPEMLVWIDPLAGVLGQRIGKPGTSLAEAGASLREAMARPMIGPSHIPDRIRVASAALATALRSEHPSLEVICAPTPEIDRMEESMQAWMKENRGEAPTYLSEAVDANCMAGLFRAAAALYRAQPWKVFPSDESVLFVSIEALGVRGEVVSVIGQGGQGFGFLRFADQAAFQAFITTGEARERGLAIPPPAHFALCFERGADVDKALRKEIVVHGWDVAGPKAYPACFPVDAQLVTRPPTVGEITIAEAIAWGWVEVVKDRKTFGVAWKQGDGLERRYSVPTHAGMYDVVFGVPVTAVNRPGCSPNFVR